MDELKLPEEWERIRGIQVIDADGWRPPVAQDWNVEITENEFIRRSAISTCRLWNWGPDALA